MKLFTVNVEAKHPPIHVYPVDDIIKHSIDGEEYCECMPKIEVSLESLIYIHNLMEES